MAGLEPVIAPEKTRSALAAVHRHNFRTSLSDHVNPARVYALEDEGGLLLCTWPHGGMPMVPAPYAEEVWTGLEYAAASHMLMHGLVSEALSIIDAARARYDGRRRNPFNEIECGSYYARSLSAWALVNAWSGLQADLRSGTLEFSPVSGGDQTLFWSAGSAPGQLTIADGVCKLSVLGGSITLSEIKVGEHELPFATPRALTSGESVSI